jgi:hypothetical protein
VNRRPRTAAERLERLRRDQEAYRRISLARRSHARFKRDLAIIPHPFLVVGAMRMAPLCLPAEEVIVALRGKAVWTLDTAARLLTGHGFLVAGDLTGYFGVATWAQARSEGWVGDSLTGDLTIEPLYHRPTMLIAHLPDGDDPPVGEALPSGDLTVGWDLLIRDVVGTLGWRPDLLTRLEAWRDLAGS